MIVDECHHVVNNPEQASMFAAVLKCLPARWRFGLTASDTRSDGLSETIFRCWAPAWRSSNRSSWNRSPSRPGSKRAHPLRLYAPRNESPIDYVR